MERSRMFKAVISVLLSLFITLLAGNSVVFASGSGTGHGQFEAPPRRVPIYMDGDRTDRDRGSEEGSSDGQAARPKKHSLPSMIYIPQRIQEQPTKHYIINVEFPVKCCCEGSSTEEKLIHYKLYDPSGAVLWGSGTDPADIVEDKIQKRSVTYITDEHSKSQIENAPKVSTGKDPYCPVKREEEVVDRGYRRCSSTLVSDRYTPAMLLDNYRVLEASAEGHTSYDICDNVCEDILHVKEKRVSRCVCLTGKDKSEATSIDSVRFEFEGPDDIDDVTNEWIYRHKSFVVRDQQELDNILFNGEHDIRCQRLSRRGTERDNCGYTYFDEEWDCEVLVGYRENNSGSGGSRGTISGTGSGSSAAKSSAARHGVARHGGSFLDLLLGNSGSGSNNSGAASNTGNAGSVGGLLGVTGNTGNGGNAVGGNSAGGRTVREPVVWHARLRLKRDACGIVCGSYSERLCECEDEDLKCRVRGNDYTPEWVRRNCEVVEENGNTKKYQCSGFVATVRYDTCGFACEFKCDDATRVRQCNWSQRTIHVVFEDTGNDVTVTSGQLATSAIPDKDTFYRLLCGQLGLRECNYSSLPMTGVISSPGHEGLRGYIGSQVVISLAEGSDPECPNLEVVISGEEQPQQECENVSYTCKQVYDTYNELAQENNPLPSYLRDISQQITEAAERVSEGECDVKWDNMVPLNICKDESGQIISVSLLKTENKQSIADYCLVCKVNKPDLSEAVCIKGIGEFTTKLYSVDMTQGSVVDEVCPDTGRPSGSGCGLWTAQLLVKLKGDVTGMKIPSLWSESMTDSIVFIADSEHHTIEPDVNRMMVNALQAWVNSEGANEGAGTVMAIAHYVARWNIDRNVSSVPSGSVVADLRNMQAPSDSVAWLYENSCSYNDPSYPDYTALAGIVCGPAGLVLWKGDAVSTARHAMSADILYWLDVPSSIVQGIDHLTWRPGQPYPGADLYITGSDGTYKLPNTSRFNKIAVYPVTWKKIYCLCASYDDGSTKYVGFGESQALQQCQALKRECEAGQLACDLGPVGHRQRRQQEQCRNTDMTCGEIQNAYASGKIKKGSALYEAVNRAVDEYNRNPGKYVFKPDARVPVRICTDPSTHEESIDLARSDVNLLNICFGEESPTPPSEPSGGDAELWDVRVWAKTARILWRKPDEKKVGIRVYTHSDIEETCDQPHEEGNRWLMPRNYDEGWNALFKNYYEAPVLVLDVNTGQITRTTLADVILHCEEYGGKVTEIPRSSPCYGNYYSNRRECAVSSWWDESSIPMEECTRMRMCVLPGCAAVIVSDWSDRGDIYPNTSPRSLFAHDIRTGILVGFVCASDGDAYSIGRGEYNSLADALLLPELLKSVGLISEDEQIEFVPPERVDDYVGVP